MKVETGCYCLARVDTKAAGLAAVTGLLQPTHIPATNPTKTQDLKETSTSNEDIYQHQEREREKDRT